MHPRTQKPNDIQNRMWKERSEFARKRKIALYKSNQQYTGVRGKSHFFFRPAPQWRGCGGKGRGGEGGGGGGRGERGEGGGERNMARSFRSGHVSVRTGGANRSSCKHLLSESACCYTMCGVLCSPYLHGMTSFHSASLSQSCHCLFLW